MKLKIFIAFLLIAVIVFAVYSAVKTDEFTPAENFPREALVYVQINDLPQFIKLWNESKFKERYESSENYADFQNNHLGRKLASRWSEFNAAAGFSIDLETLAGLSENRAAVALYDVGKLEFVFIAPVSDEIFEATKFLQKKDNFAEETLDDGTTVYRAAVEADRGRQKQNLIFTHAKGNFIVATSEKLLAQTLSNINGSQQKNRLSDDASFKILSEKTATHLATVWTNQAALNDDYYFKRYWLMSDVKELKNIRAGIFDFEMREEKLTERRRFLLKESVNLPPLDEVKTTKMLVHLPANSPFYRLQAAQAQTIDEAVKQTYFDRSQHAEAAVDNDYSYDSDDYYWNDYNSLGEKYDEFIDDDEKHEKTEQREKESDFAKALLTARPNSILRFERPEILPAPLFAEFKRAAIFYLDAPEHFNRENFESEVAKKFAAQTMVSGSNAKFEWKTVVEGDFSRRELRLPMLDWKTVYAVRGNELILTNNADYFQEITATENKAQVEARRVPFSDLTVINLDQRKAAFDDVFSLLNEKNPTDSFFTGNVGSLLDSMSGVGKIEIRKSYSQNIFEEELILNIDPE